MAGGRGKVAVAAAVAFALALPAFAGAQGGYETDPTREQWVEQADRACKNATPRFRQLVQRVRRAGNVGNPVKYGGALVRLAKFLLDLRAELAGLEPPPEDADLIEKWLATSTKADKAAIRSGRAYIRKKFSRGKSAYRKASKLSKKAFRLGRPFDFEYC